MKFDFTPKAFLIDDIAETQDGGLVHNREVITKYAKNSHDDPVGQLIGDAVARLNEPYGDLDDVKRNLDYALHEITKARDAVNRHILKNAA